MMHFMKHTKLFPGIVGIKLDMTKAFDRMEWDPIMLHLGFSDKWCKLIHFCISTARISILFNGTPTDYFSSSRGLRQRDSISPYLFILCMEGFSTMISNAVNNKMIDAVIPARGGPAISHLLFADDCMLFTKSSGRSIENLLEIISKFTSSSGQLVKLEKSSVIFSHNLSVATREDISQMLKMKPMSNEEKYLGTQLKIPRSKDKFFDDTVDRMHHKLQAWQGKILSLAAHATQIQASLSTIANYQMGMYELPDTTHKRIEKVVRNYFWSKKKKKGMHHISWQAVCKPKDTVV